MSDPTENYENAYHLTQKELIKLLKKHTLLSPDTSIYHYTSVEVLKNIVEGQRLYATHIKYMNDWQEYDNGYARLTRHLKQQLTTKVGSSDSAAKVWKIIDESLEGKCPSRPQYGRLQKDKPSLLRLTFPEVFTISFCTTNDLLSQWAVYAKESGVSIEFDFSEFAFYDGSMDEQIQNKCRTEELERIHYFKYNRPYKMMYDEQEAVRIIEEIVDEAITRIKEVQNTADASLKQESIVWQTIANLYAMVPYFKDENFHHEQEVRLAFRPIREVIGGIHIHETRIHYRVKNNTLIPFLKIGWEKNEEQAVNQPSRLPIKSITIGPGSNQDVVFNSVVHFMEHQAPLADNDNWGELLADGQYQTASGIIIRKSAIPYIF